MSPGRLMRSRFTWSSRSPSSYATVYVPLSNDFSTMQGWYRGPPPYRASTSWPISSAMSAWSTMACCHGRLAGLSAMRPGLSWPCVRKRRGPLAVNRQWRTPCVCTLRRTVPPNVGWCRCVYTYRVSSVVSPTLYSYTSAVRGVGHWSTACNRLLPVVACIVACAPPPRALWLGLGTWARPRVYWGVGLSACQWTCRLVGNAIGN